MRFSVFEGFPVKNSKISQLGTKESLKLSSANTVLYLLFEVNSSTIQEVEQKVCLFFEMFTRVGRMWIEKVPPEPSPLSTADDMSTGFLPPHSCFGTFSTLPEFQQMKSLKFLSSYDWLGLRWCSIPRPKEMILFHLRYDYFHPHRRRRLEIVQSEQGKKQILTFN